MNAEQALCVLGIADQKKPLLSFTCEEISAAFRARAMQLHPDKHTENEEESKQQFQLLNGAKDYLLKKIRRAEKHLSEGVSAEVQISLRRVFALVPGSCTVGGERYEFCSAIKDIEDRQRVLRVGKKKNELSYVRVLPVAGADESDFHVQGYDLVLAISLSIQELCCGFVRTLRHPNGICYILEKKAPVRINQHPIPVPGAGLPAGKGRKGGVGDLLVYLCITGPEQLTREEGAEIEKLFPAPLPRPVESGALHQYVKL